MTQTFLFFDDMFPMIFHTDRTRFSLLPKWENRVIEIKEFATKGTK